MANKFNVFKFSAQLSLTIFSLAFCVVDLITVGDVGNCRKILK